MILDTTNLQQMLYFTKFIIYRHIISKHTLKTAGVLSEEEFQLMKGKLIAQY
jgi:hypothetical protein